MRKTAQINEAFARDQVRQQGVSDEQFELIYEANPAFGALHAIGDLNGSYDQRGFFISPETNTAFAGFQRSWGATDLLVRAIGNFNLPGVVFSDTFFLQEEGVFLDEPGLMKHSAVSHEGYDFVTPEDVDDIFEGYKENEFQFELTLDVDEFLASMRDRRNFSDGNFKDQTVTLLPSDRMNSEGHIVGILRYEPETQYNDGFFFVQIGMNGEGRSLVVDNSLINLRGTDIDKPVMFKYKGEYPSEHLDGEMVEHCEIVTRFGTGTRVMYQTFPSGQVIPVYGSFSAYPDLEEVDETYSTVTQGPDFLTATKYQDRRTLNTMPMLTFQLGIFERLIEAFADYKYVTIYSMESRIAPVYVRGVEFQGSPDFYELEAIISPISPYSRGKILEV